MIQNELYFAKHSNKWNGGVAFINTSSAPDTFTYARKYLVTKEQFEDIAKQETNSEDAIPINFDEVLVQGHTIFKRRSWYGKALLLGMDSGYPLLTLTNELNLQDGTKPSESYLITIMKGISQVFPVNQIQLTDYFLQKRGITGNYSQEQLTQLAATATVN